MFAPLLYTRLRYTSESRDERHVTNITALLIHFVFLVDLARVLWSYNTKGLVDY